MGFFDFLKEREPEIEEIEKRLEEGKKAKEKKSSLFSKKSSSKKQDSSKEYETIDDIHQKKQKVLSGMVIKVFFFSIVSLAILSLLIVVYKSFNSEQRVAKQPKEESFEINITKEDYWKLATNKKINKLSQEIKGIKKEVKEELNSTVTKINDMIVDFQEQMEERMKRIDESLQALDQKYEKNLQEFKEAMLSYVESKTKETKSEFSTKLEESLKNIKKEVITIEKGAKALPIPKFNIPLKKEEKPSKTVLAKPAKKPFVSEKKLEEKYASLDLETLPTDDTINYEKLYQIKHKEQNKSKKRPPLHIMTGFAKATLITGVSASTFGEGIEHPKPVVLSLDTPSVIANDDYYHNLARCKIFISRYP